MKKGKVWLVGAGPGDVGLLTLKGKRVLEEADVVVYDRLIGQSVLLLIPPHAERINVGKRSSHHTMKQQKINEVLLHEAEKGKKVVRLKGGDPFLFGRGGEELELLEEHGIPFEIVPGVTSSIAVPAYNGIPVTHRDFCSSVHIITGHKKEGNAYDIDFEALVKTHGTLVFLMGVTALPDICGALLDHGMPGETPAAILQKGTTAGQGRIVATVETLADEVARQGIETPAIIVVGQVCGLESRFAWYEKQQLAGFKVLVTRPRQLISKMAEKLRARGAEVLEIPSIATVPIENEGKLEECLDHLDEYTAIAFTSPTGARVFFEKLHARHVDVRRLDSVKLAAIGPGTAGVLEEKGLFVDIMPESVYDGESLAVALLQKCFEGNKILLPRAEEGNAALVNILEQQNILVDDVPTYRTVYEKQDLVDISEGFAAGDIDCAVFTSASTVKGFAAAAPELDYTRVCAACIGKQTKAAADALHMRTYMAKEATMDALVDLVCEIADA